MTRTVSAFPSSVSPREGYARWAATYDEDANPVAALQERLLRSLLPDAQMKTVVDLGCGTGRALSLWRDQGASRLIGIDLSPQMIARAVGNADALIVADCGALPLVNCTADLVSCCLTLGYLADIDLFASEMARIVSPDGSVLISELHPESVDRFGWRRGFTRRGQSTNIEAYAVPIQKVVTAFEQHGFKADLLLEVPFSDPELPLFEAAGKRERFERFREHPAIYILQLRRNESQPREPITFEHARVALSGNEAETANVTIAGRAICSLGIRPRDEGTSLDLSGHLLLPGLINAHDHLEFALFPRLGRGGYQNSREWAEEIYRPDESPVREHLRVPKWVRLWWGAIRNLLCGVTTVCHHNPYDYDVFVEDFPVRVVRDFAWAHSLAFDSELITRYRNAGADVPFVVHAAEGVDRTSAEEVRTLFKLGVLDERSVIVHGTGLDVEGVELLRNCGAALVWCPSSNVFLFNQTVAANAVASLPLKALASDSPLTAAGDLLDEIRFAATLGASPETLFQLVTTGPKRVLRLKQGEGQIRPGAAADLIAVRDHGLAPAETLVSLSSCDIELVIAGGAVRLASDTLMALLPEEFTGGLELLKVDGFRRWIRAPIGELLRLSREALGPDIRMCGRLLTQ